MADSRIVQKLDEKLIADGVIDSAFRDDYQKVHSKLNSHLKKSGAILPEKTFEQGEQNLRKWLFELYRMGASQDKLTSYLRCGLAHLSFDFIESSYKSIDDEDLIARALVSFKNREFHKTYFKAAEIKRSPVKKKPVKKKAVKKKPVKKKPVKKKLKKTAKKSSRKIAKRTSKKIVKKKAGKSVKKKSVRKKKPAVKKSRKAKRKARPKKKSLLVKLFG